MSKRYWWIKLKDTFRTSDTVDYFMSLPNGIEYVVIYQLLCLLTVNTHGRLVREIGNVTIPFSADKLARECKWFSTERIQEALELYQAFGLVRKDDEGFLFMVDHDNLVGSETESARRKRASRAAKNEEEPAQGDIKGEEDDTGQDVGQSVGHCPEIVRTNSVEMSRQILDIRDKEKDIYKTLKNISVDSPESTLPEIDGVLTDDAKSEEPEKPKKKKAPLKLTVQQIEAFNEFYANFPRHTHRIDAEKAYAKALTRASVEAILAGAINYASWVKRNKVEQKYVTHPSTWLNAGAWDDELEDRVQTGRTNQPSGRITSNRRDDDYSTV